MPALWLAETCAGVLIVTTCGGAGKTVNDAIMSAPRVGVKEEDLHNLREWTCKLLHVNTISDDVLYMFLNCRDGDVEWAKRTIESYVRIASTAPEIFKDCDPSHPDIQHMLSILNYVVLPERDRNGRVVIIFGLSNGDSSIFNFSNMLKIFCMYTFLNAYITGRVSGFVLLVDSNNVGMGHLIKTNVGLLRKFVNFLQDAIPINICEIIIVNSLAVSRMIFNLARPFMKKEYYDKFTFFSRDSESLYEKVPKEMLPSDFGGLQKSIKEFTKISGKTLLDMRDVLLEEEAKLRLKDFSS